MLLELLLMGFCGVYIAVFRLRIFALLIKVLQWLTLRFVAFWLRRVSMSQRSPVFTSVVHMHVLYFSVHFVMFERLVITFSIIHVFFSHFNNMMPCLLLDAVLPNFSTPYIFQFQTVCLLYICSGFFFLIWIHNIVISLCTIRSKLLSLCTTRCC